LSVKIKGEAPIIYYDDVHTDEFSTAEITPIKIDGGYKYVHEGIFKKFTHFFWYKIVGIPMAKAYLKIKFSHETVGREVLEKHKNDAYFLYGNHTQQTGDAVMPAVLCRPKEVYVIVHPNNVSMPYLGKITPSLGALPLPDDMAAMRNFIKAVELRLSQNKVIAIYPEAHIWPFYTGIRPFPDNSFQYPVRYDKPVYCFTDTYQLTGGGKRVKMVTYIDGPFYPDKTLSVGKRRADLRERVYNIMTERAKNSNVDVIRYEKRQ